MSAKIKFSIFNLLFRLFSFMADRTNGWAVFVKPKLVFGSLVLSLGISACSGNDTPNDARGNITCYDIDMEETIDSTKTANTDSIQKKSDSIVAILPPEVIDVSCYVHEPKVLASCYDIDYKPEIEIEDTNDSISMKVYDVVEQMPEFPGGEKLRDFINKNLIYPSIAVVNSWSGKVVCTFIIERNGSVSNVEIRSSPHDFLSKEVIRVINSMPRWIPGKQDGAPVRVRLTIPVIFKIENE